MNQMTKTKLTVAKLAAIAVITLPLGVSACASDDAGTTDSDGTTIIGTSGSTITSGSGAGGNSSSTSGLTDGQDTETTD